MTRKAGRISSRDVARVAGVSQQTVSLVVRDSPLILDETKTRVWGVIRQLGYHPHAAAVALRSSRSHTLAYFESHVSVALDALRNQLLHALTMRAKAAGYHILIDGSSDVERCLALLRSGRVDGAVVDWQVGDGVLRQMVASGAPLVVAGRDVGGLPVSCVLADEEDGTYQMTRYLLELGHRRLALVVGDDERGGRPSLDSNANAYYRVSGYKRALAEANVPSDLGRIHTGEWTFRSGYEVGRRLLSEEPRPTAIFALSELLAVGVLRAASGLGLNVPRDVSVVGIEESDWVEYVEPQLTAVRVPMQQVGAHATDVLVGLLGDLRGTVQHTVFPVEIVVRASSGPPPGVTAPGIAAQDGLEPGGAQPSGEPSRVPLQADPRRSSNAHDVHADHPVGKEKPHRE